MSIVGQPESYSDMLKRIFITTLISGVICAFILAAASPETRQFLESFKTEADLPFVKGIKSLYVLLPLLLAGFSRSIYLHDKLSDLLFIRYHFDTQYILYPMATRTVGELTPDHKAQIWKMRQNAMSEIFYSFAGFSDPKIDPQLIRNALDSWGWFWVALESIFIFSLTLIGVLILGKTGLTVLCTVGILMFLLINLVLQGITCKRNASREVDAILQDDERRGVIRHYFESLFEAERQVG